MPTPGWRITGRDGSKGDKRTRLLGTPRIRRRTGKVRTKVALVRLATEVADVGLVAGRTFL